MRRRLVVAACVVGGILLVPLLYVAFADLGRHKARIERFLTDQTGRAVTIAGPLHIRVLPSPIVVADGVRVANASWGSKPAMVEIGHFATRIGFWSLIRGPIRVKTLEVSDVDVVLETNPEGDANWTLGEPAAGGSGKQAKNAPPAKSAEAPPAEDDAGVPAILEDGRFRNVKAVYRQPGRKEHVVAVDELTVATRQDGLLSTRGQGRLDAYPLRLEGHVGTLDALRSGRNIQIALESALGNVTAKADGRISLGPLDGADLKLSVASPDVSGWLKDLEAPPVVEGALALDAKLKDAGERTALDVVASVGDVSGKVKGTLQSLALPGSELNVEATLADVARIANVLQVKGVKPGELKLAAHVATKASEIHARDVVATLNGTEAKADAVVRTAAEPGQTVRFDVTGESLAGLYEGLPAIPFGAKGTYSGSAAAIKVPDLVARFGDSDVEGSVSMLPAARSRLDADLRSRNMDLTPFMSTKPKKKKEPPPSATEQVAEATADIEEATAEVRAAAATESAKAEAAEGAEAAEAPKAEAAAAADPAPAEAAKATADEAAAAPAAETAPAPAENTQQAETAQPAAQPETAQPETAQPETAQPETAQPETAQAADAAAQPAPEANAPPVVVTPDGKFVFTKAPLRLDALAKSDMNVRFRAGRLKADTSVLTDVDSRVTLDQGRLKLDAKGNGVAGGTAVCGVQLTPAGKGADLRVRLDVRELRAGLLAAEGLDPAVTPPTTLLVDLHAKGGSARAMAAGANGTVIFTQSPGEMKSGAVDMFGSDLLSKIGGSLNPFGKKDKTTKLECTVARVDVVDGKMTIEPVLMQSEKLVITANGEVDLKTEGLKFKFGSKPRSGFGVSLSAVTNAITELGGTLSSPLPGVGAVAKGGIKGALAFMTAGLSVAAEGLANRVTGEKDRCADILAKAQLGPAAKTDQAQAAAPPEAPKAATPPPQ
jgi:uncharacterized protein involved in outer membrane biogenesis